MSFTKKELRRIYNGTTGYCHICRKKLSFTNYGLLYLKGAWEVEHSNPKARGGTNRFNNLYPACMKCNRSKRDGTTRTARAKFDQTRAPLSKSKRKAVRQGNAIGFGIVGGIIGSVAGPIGTIIGAAIGSKLGYNKNPDND
jgi:5-methylcytosine-specific restriction endonuclease McrA